MKTLVPTNDFVVVRPDEREKQSEGGILIPDGATQRPHRGTVVAVGRGRYLEGGKFVEVDLEEGDVVYFMEHAGHKIILEGEELWVMGEGDILAIELIAL